MYIYGENQASRRAVRFGETKYILGGHESCFRGMFKTHFPG